MDSPQELVDSDNPDSASNKEIGPLFALATGFFAGLVWLATKLADRPLAEVEVVFVAVSVKPSCVDQFVISTRENRNASRQEVACLKYDIYQAEADPTAFVLHEVYLAEGGERAHKATPHYAKWHKEVAAMMAHERRRLNEMPAGYRILAT